MATPQASPEPNSSPEGLTIDWRLRRGDPGLGAIEEGMGLQDAVVFKNRFYLRGQIVDENDNWLPAILASTDGLTWQRVLALGDLDSLRTLAATSNAIATFGEIRGEGGGQAVWLSDDGDTWEQLSDTGLDAVRAMTATRDGFVAIGSAVWTSADGHDWQAVTSPSAQNVAAWKVAALATDGRNLIALTQPEEFKVVSAWTSADGGTTWAGPVSLPQSRPYSITAITSSPLGWVVAGESYTRDVPPGRVWISTDGVDWEHSPGPDRTVRDLLSTDAGLIAVGFEYVNPGCALNPADVQGYTWTSVDGRIWTLMEPTEFRYRRIEQMLRDGRTLIGVGIAYESDEDDTGEGTVWTAQLPRAAGPGLGTSPRPAEYNGGCGGD